MYELVTEQMGHDAIVIDADDLLDNPGIANIKQLM